MTTPQMNDPFHTNPPQTLPFHPHDKSTYMGVIYGKEYVACTEPECGELVIFERAAEHQASHLTDPLAKLAAITMQLKMLQLQTTGIEQSLATDDALAAAYRLLNRDLVSAVNLQANFLDQQATAQA